MTTLEAPPLLRPGNLPTAVGDIKTAIEAALDETSASGRQIADDAAEARITKWIGDAGERVAQYVIGISAGDLREAHQVMVQIDKAHEFSTWGDGVKGTGEAAAQILALARERERTLEQKIFRSLPEDKQAYGELRDFLKKVFAEA